MKKTLFFLIQFLSVSAEGQEKDSLYWVQQNDSLNNIQRIYMDSLRMEIRKDIHNYEAIKLLFHESDSYILNANFETEYFHKLFTEIEKGKNLEGDYYKLKYEILGSRADDCERITLLKRILKKFPNSPEFNNLLGSIYYNKIYRDEKPKIYENTLNSAKYLEKSLIKEKNERIIRTTGGKLYQLYGITKNQKRRKHWEKRIIGKPYKGFYITSAWSQNTLSIDNRADEKISAFVHYVDNLDSHKERFVIQNTGKNYFNFLWLRSFFRTVVISLEEHEDTYTLTWKISESPDSYIPYSTYSKKISKDHYLKFISILTLDNIENSYVDVPVGYDGSDWYLESKLDHKNSIRYEWSPLSHGQQTGYSQSFVKACLYLINLTGIKTVPYSPVLNPDFQYDPAEKEGFMLL